MGKRLLVGGTMCKWHVTLGMAASAASAHTAASRVRPAGHGERSKGSGQGSRTASARSTATVTFSRICSATVLLHVNWSAIAASNTCFTATTLYSVSSSVNCTCASVG